MKKKIIGLLLVLILCVSGSGSVFAMSKDIEPYWAHLYTLSCELGPYNGLFSNSYVRAEAKCSDPRYDARLTVSIQKKSGSQYVDTGKSWTVGPSTNASLNITTFSLGTGSYIAHCVAVVLDPSGNTVETVTMDSNVYIVG